MNAKTEKIIQLEAIKHIRPYDIGYRHSWEINKEPILVKLFQANLSFKDVREHENNVYNEIFPLNRIKLRFLYGFEV
jgi:hypothetical protein